MATSIQVPVGETVKASITLAYKKAEVARMADAALYQTIDFYMVCDERKAQFQGADRQFSDGQFMISDQARKPLSDDQSVEAFFRFPADDRLHGKVCAAGQRWQLFLAYLDTDGTKWPSQGDPRLLPLGDVNLTDPKLGF